MDSGKKAIKVSIIEDSEIHCTWLKTELSDIKEIGVVSIDNLGRKGIESVKSKTPDLVLLDFQLPDLTGLEVVKRIKSFDEQVKIFFITAHTEISIIERIFSDINVDGLAIKGSHYFEENLLTAITYVSSGGTYLDPSLLGKLRECSKTDSLSALTRREFEVLIQLSMGKNDAQVAIDLCVETSYIRNLKSKISKKTNKKNLGSLTNILIDNSNNYFKSN